MATTAMQLNLTSPYTLTQNAAVKFDEQVFQSGDVSYNQLSGEITLINWRANALSSSAAGVSFAILTSQPDTISGSSAARTGQFTGFAVINVTTPQTVKLINSQNSSVSLSTYGGAAAGLTVTKYEEFSVQSTTACLAAKQWAYLLEQITTLYASNLVTIFYDRLASSFSAYPYGVYTSPYGSGAGFFVMYLGAEYVLLPLYQICAVYLGDDAIYDETIQYLPFPDPAAMGCDTDMFAAFYSYIPVGENVGIQISVNTNAQGDVYKNEFAVLVLANEDKSSPLFFFVPNVQRVVTTVAPPELLSKDAKNFTAEKKSGKVIITTE